MPITAPTAKDRHMVEAMTSYGIPLVEIAKVVEVSVQTLLKYFRREIDRGAPIANVKVAKFLFSRASGQGPDERANVQAAMFWARTRMNWSEKTIHEIVAPGSENMEVTVHIPPDLSVLSEMELAELYRRIAHGDPIYSDNVVPFKPRRKRLSDLAPRPL